MLTISVLCVCVLIEVCIVSVLYYQCEQLIVGATKINALQAGDFGRASHVLRLHVFMQRQNSVVR